MTEDNFILKNENQWRKLEAYNKTLSNKSVSALKVSEIDEFAELFRSVSQNLAYAKTHYPNGRSAPYLNQLAGIAHQHFYLRRKGGLSSAAQYVRKGFPRAIQAKRSYFAFVLMLFLVGVLASLIMVRADTDYASLFLPAEYIQSITQSSPRPQTDTAGDLNYSFLSAGIMTNNIYVSLTAFAGGVTAGLGTLVIIFFNGAMLGALSGLAAMGGFDMTNFFALILPHGFIELTAIFISGMCGMIIAKSILIPGDLKRKDSFIKGAKEAAFFVPGIVLMLIIAGLIEGFFTPLPILPWIKLAFSFAVLILMIFGYRLAIK